MNGSWMGAGPQKKTWIFQPTPHPPERGEGLEMELLIDHA